MRGVRYREITEELRRRLADGDPGPGRLLPSEAELSERYEASRVTIRKALEGLRAEGLIDSRQGLGWFVVGRPVHQTLGRLATIEDQLTASGIRSERRILDFGFVSHPPMRVQSVLGAGATLRVRRVNLADGEPFARVTVWCPEDLAADLSRTQVAERSFYDLLPVTLAGATQTIEADAATRADAELLEVPVGSPILSCRRVTFDASGRGVLLSESVFPSRRTAFTVDLPHAEASIAPSGLRLVK